MLPSKYPKEKVPEAYCNVRGDSTSKHHKSFFGPRKLNSVLKKIRNAKKEKKREKERSRSSKKSGPNIVDSEVSVSKDTRTIPPDDGLVVGNLSGSPKADNSEDVEIPPEVAAWRFGPAQYWYDAMGVPENPKNFDFGMKRGNAPISEGLGEDFPDDTYLMVSQLHWEDDVIWNGDDLRDAVMQRLKNRNNAAGWVPYSNHRTAPSFSSSGKNVNSSSEDSMCCSEGFFGNKIIGKQSGAGMFSKQEQITPENTKETWYSIFPVENDELVYGIWEDDVIWDPDNMTRIPEPKILTWDPNDENLNFVIPEENDPPKQCQDSDSTPKMKVLHPHVKKSKILLGKAGVIKVVEEDLPPTPPKSPNRDEFNVSNDKYYMPQSSEVTLRLQISGSHLIRHATPVMELRAPFVPTHLGPVRLQNFHRPAMKRFSHGPLSQPGHHPVYPLLKHIQKKEKQREKEREASGGGEVFFTRTAEDLTGRDGELILVEFSEEHPPLMNLVGMCSRIKNYYKRKADKEQSPPDYKFGELAYAHTSPFLGTLRQGQSLQAIENNMYRAPIYEHLMPETDFLIIRTRKQYCIRECGALFVAGQQCPSYEVPSPNSKRTSNFVRDFLQVFIYRLFWKSTDSPKRIKMEDIRRAFPSHSESSIRKRLKLCADFKRTGMDSNWWVIRSDFRLPSEEEIQAMVSPEQCCAYFSMLASEQRLKDAGYGENFLFAPQDGEDDENDEEEMQLKMEDEVKVAPWNTTRAYIQAMQGKCLLQLTGPADPTGCGEGFSYVREPNKPSQGKEEHKTQQKKSVSGTDADLRRLSLNNARSLLRKFGVPGEEIKKLSRWEVIDVVRTLSTEKAKAGEEGMTKFSRGNRFSIAEHHERYKAECQRIFDLQNQVLSSNEILSTDDEESSNDDISDIEEMGKNIENMLSNKKTSCQLSLEKEEQERKELRKMLDNQEGKSHQWNRNKDRNKDEESSPSSQLLSGKVLKIYRTFCNAEGKEYTRVEFVRDPAVIEAYVKIRTTKDEAFIKQFATLDEHQKEEMKREKRCIQEQLRRIKRIQEREQLSKGRTDISADSGSFTNYSTNQLVFAPTSYLDSPASLEKSSYQSQTQECSQTHAPKRKKPKLKPDLKLKCGGCGSVGHMRTNKACPLYQPSYVPPVNVAMTEEQEEEMEKHLNDDEHLINVDGTKVKLSSKLLKHAEEMKRCTLVLKVPKGAIHAPKRRRAVNEMHCDYLTRQQRPVNRRRTDPAVVLSSILETILNEMREMPDVQPFLFPVNAKSVPDYYTIVKKPMDLQTMREKLRQKKYKSREEFLADVNQIVANSSLYNGITSPITLIAKRMLSCCVERMEEREERLIHLERAINPLLDDDDQIALGYILENVVNKLKGMSEASPFLKPVNKKLLKTFESTVKETMDLDKISKKVSLHKYHDCEEFYSDVKLIFKNSSSLHGKSSDVTLKAETLVKTCYTILQEFGGKLSDESVEQGVSSESVDAVNGLQASMNTDEGVRSNGKDRKKFESSSRKHFADKRIEEFIKMNLPMKEIDDSSDESEEDEDSINIASKQISHTSMEEEIEKSSSSEDDSMDLDAESSYLDGDDGSEIMNVDLNSNASNADYSDLRETGDESSLPVRESFVQSTEIEDGDEEDNNVDDDMEEEEDEVEEEEENNEGNIWF